MRSLREGSPEGLKDRELPVKIFVNALLVLSVLVLTQVAADAHSTKGRMKVLLKKDVINVDDAAYYIEPYVHRKKYKGKYEKWKNRFYVKDFTRVEQKGRKAEVFFAVLDVKKSSSFDDSMVFTRDKDGVWFHIDEKGEKKAVYTYVNKKGYYYKKYVLPGSIAGLVLAGGGFMLIRRRKRLGEKKL